MRSGDPVGSGGLTDLRPPEVLDPSRHDRDGFVSGRLELDHWLQRYARQNRQRNTAATWVVTTGDHRVVAYASLSMTAVDRSAAPRPVGRGAPDPVPALLIGRLATDRRFQKLGVGTTLVTHALLTAVELNTKAACRAVIVSAVDREARRWWEPLGFHPFDPDDPNHPDLYLLTAEVETTLEALDSSGQ